VIFYKDIYECPIDNFHWVEERKSFEFLIKEGKYKPNKHDEKLSALYEDMKYQLIDEFGVSPEFELYFYKLRDINKRELEVLKGNRSAITFLNINKNELKMIEERMSSNHEEPKKVNARMHRLIQTHYQGRDSHKLTVFEFYNDIHDIQAEAEEAERLKRIKQKQNRKHG
jgi:hypothetical protein